MTSVAMSPEPQDSSDRDVQLIISILGMATFIILILVALFVIAMIMFDPNALANSGLFICQSKTLMV